MGLITGDSVSFMQQNENMLFFPKFRVAIASVLAMMLCHKQSWTGVIYMRNWLWIALFLSTITDLG
jgi:hypothetical protein